jgi:hypothetical protein
LFPQRGTIPRILKAANPDFAVASVPDRTRE